MFNAMMGSFSTPSPDEGGLGALPAARWWHEDPKRADHVVCELCPRGCTLAPGQRGYCFVRQNYRGQLVSTSYGRSTGFCVDPIEKKPLHHFYPGTAAFSFGTLGCNLGCRFCQNWITTRSRDEHAACEPADPESIARTAHRLSCRSVALTYNDPIVWAEYAIDTAKACRDLGIRTVAVTSGYMSPGARAAFYRWIDAANVDLKAITEEFYREYCAARLEPVLDTLRYIAEETDTWLEVTNLLIPAANDSPDEIHRLCAWIAEHLGPDVPLHFSAFHPDHQLTDRGPTPLATLVKAYEIARQEGLRYVYLGNVVAPDYQNTLCPACGRVVIERDAYVVGAYHAGGGRCGHCGEAIAGVFDDQPGNWGGRRMSVRIDRAGAGDAQPASRRGGGPPSQTSDDATSAPRRAGEEPRGDHRPVAMPPPGGASAPVDDSASPSDRPKRAAQAAGAVERPELAPEEESRVVRAAAETVAATVLGRRPAPVAEQLGNVATTPVYGAFVSLKRAGQLRSCCGYLGASLRLGEALYQAAVRAAKDDPRFPPIEAGELDRLDMDVWLLWGLRPIRARGRDRAAEIVIGKHGLQIARGSARGLLLPGVAVDHGLDAEGFLRQVCLKAGLPTDAWLADDTELHTFEGYALKGRLAASRSAGESLRPTPAELRALVEWCRRNLLALRQGAAPEYYLLGGYDGPVHGFVLSVEPPGSGGAVEASQLAVHGDLPLQSSLFRHTQALAHVLATRTTATEPPARWRIDVSVFRDPQPLDVGPSRQPDEFDTATRGVAVFTARGYALVFDPRRAPGELAGEAKKLAGLDPGAEVPLYTLAVATTAQRVVLAHRAAPDGQRLSAVRGEPGENLAEANSTAGQPHGDAAERRRESAPAASAPVASSPAGSRESVRPAAVAGKFYPGREADIARALDAMLAAADPIEPKTATQGETPQAQSREPEAWAGALVPHAGWVYSGTLAAQTLRRVRIPARVVVFCPQHRGGGAAWAVAPHRWWQWPGGRIESDVELAERLAAAAPELELDADVHREEHAIEVQLPILARLAPGCRVVGVAIARTDLDELLRVAGALAGVLASIEPAPLLLASSDMSHYVEEDEARRLDGEALRAIASLDPAAVWTTVRQRRISMCGVAACVVVMETLRRMGRLRRCQQLGYTTSAAASGDRQHVVGYAGVLFG